MLESGWKKGGSADFRNRCQMILLNDRGYEAKQIADVLQVDVITVYNNFEGLEKGGCPWH